MEIGKELNGNSRETIKNYGNQWTSVGKSMEILEEPSEILWKSMKINKEISGNPSETKIHVRKSINISREINGNPSETIRKSMQINENQ